MGLYLGCGVAFHSVSYQDVPVALHLGDLFDFIRRNFSFFYLISKTVCGLNVETETLVK